MSAPLPRVEVEDDYARGYLDGRLRELDLAEALATALGPLSSRRLRDHVAGRRAELLGREGRSLPGG